MKKLTLFLTFVLCLVSSTCFGAWTITANSATTGLLSYEGNWFTYKVTLISDGDALTAGAFTSTMSPGLLNLFKQGTHIRMSVVPGTGDAAPTTTINIKFSSVNGDFFDETGYSNSANTHYIDLSKDSSNFLSGYDMTYITVNDIGNSGDSFSVVIEGCIARN